MNLFRKHVRVKSPRKLIELHNVPQSDHGIDAITIYHLVVYWIRNDNGLTWHESNNNEIESIVNEFSFIFCDIFSIILSFINNINYYDTHWCSKRCNSKIIDLVEDYHSLILDNSLFRHRSDNTIKWKELNMDHIISTVNSIPNNKHFIQFSLEIYQEYNEYCLFTFLFSQFCSIKNLDSSCLIIFYLSFVFCA